MTRRSFFAKLVGLVAVVPFLKLESRMARNLRARDEALYNPSEYLGSWKFTENSPLDDLPPYTYWSKSPPCLENPNGWTWRDCSQFPAVVKHWNGKEWVKA